MIWINMLIGLVLVFAGRKLFWLFVACVGFASGVHFAQNIWPIHSPVPVLILAIVLGAFGAVIAIFFQKAAIVVAGFAAGGYIAMMLIDQFTGFAVQMAWLPYIIGGVIGAVILYAVFDWALILLSALTGAAICVQMLTFKAWIEIALFILLSVAGVLFQANAISDQRGER